MYSSFNRKENVINTLHLIYISLARIRCSTVFNEILKLQISVWLLDKILISLYVLSD